MLPYFLIWAWMAVLALSARQRWSQLTSIVIWLVLTLLIGLRIEIGADWWTYLGYVDQQFNMPLNFALTSNEPGYALANWIGAKTGWEIFGVNLICGGLFSVGLVSYCRQQPYPWLALTLSFPYLTLVVAMGYSRQGVAIGLELLALLALERERLLQFLSWIGLAATFHASVLSMLVLPVASVGQHLGRFTGLLRLGLLAGSSYGLFNAILSGSIEAYQQNYLDSEYNSQGAFVRVALCLIPALIFLWNRRVFPISQAQRSTYTLMAWLAVAAAIGLAVLPTSTAVDRVALYLIPLQIFVGSHLPQIRLLGLRAGAWCQLLVGFSFAVLSVWLFFGAHASAWLPYRNLLFEF